MRVRNEQNVNYVAFFLNINWISAVDLVEHTNEIHKKKIEKKLEEKEIVPSDIKKNVHKPPCLKGLVSSGRLQSMHIHVLNQKTHFKYFDIRIMQISF